MYAWVHVGTQVSLKLHIKEHHVSLQFIIIAIVSVMDRKVWLCQCNESWCYA